MQSRILRSTTRLCLCLCSRHRWFFQSRDLGCHRPPLFYRSRRHSQPSRPLHCHPDYSSWLAGDRDPHRRRPRESQRLFAAAKKLNALIVLPPPQAAVISLGTFPNAPLSAHLPPPSATTGLPVSPSLSELARSLPFATHKPLELRAPHETEGELNELVTAEVAFISLLKQSDGRPPTTPPAISNGIYCWLAQMRFVMVPVIAQ